jgi:peptidyl-prolyl cis-trans isomerase D
MLKAIRKNTKIFLWFAVSIFILATFVGLGSYFFTNTADVVAKVNGTKIRYESFNAAFLQRMNNYRNMYNIEINEEMAANLKKMLLNEMISKVLLLQEAKRMKIKVSNKELSEFIQKLPYFQKDGRFDKQLYMNTLKMQARTTPAVFEKDVRDSMIIQQIQEKITSGVAVTDKEVADEVAKRLKDKKPAPKPEDLLKERETIKQSLLQQKKAQVFEEWYKKLQAAAKIENNLEKIEKQLAGGTTEQ